MNVLVNFSDENFKQSRLRLNDSARKFGIDRIFSYDEHFLRQTSFYKENRSVFQYSKGFGYWVWKPYLIQKVLLETHENDTIIYSDAGIEIIADLSPLFQICNRKDILLFANGNLKNRHWTKRDSFILMEADSEKYRNGNQVDAAFCMFKNTPEIKQFVADWVEYCLDIRIVGDQPNVMGKLNFWGFHCHRHDQSVLSLLALKNKIELFRQPTQFGNHYKMEQFRIPGERNCISQYKARQVNFYSGHPYVNSPYFQLLNHHRKKSIIVNKPDLNIIQLVIASGRRRIRKIIKLLTRQ